VICQAQYAAKEVRICGDESAVPASVDRLQFALMAFESAPVHPLWFRPCSLTRYPGAVTTDTLHNLCASMLKPIRRIKPLRHVLKAETNPASPKTLADHEKLVAARPARVTDKPPAKSAKGRCFRSSENGTQRLVVKRDRDPFVTGRLILG
jgi:hypothetical protein